MEQLNVTTCRCGWTIKKKNKRWQHVAVGIVMCPSSPKLWKDPTKFVPNAKAFPAGLEVEA